MGLILQCRQHLGHQTSTTDTTATTGVCKRRMSVEFAAARVTPHFHTPQKRCKSNDWVPPRRPRPAWQPACRKAASGHATHTNPQCIINERALAVLPPNFMWDGFLAAQRVSSMNMRTGAAKVPHTLLHSSFITRYVVWAHAIMHSMLPACVRSSASCSRAAPSPCPLHIGMPSIHVHPPPHPTPMHAGITDAGCMHVRSSHHQPRKPFSCTQPPPCSCGRDHAPPPQPPPC